MADTKLNLMGSATLVLAAIGAAVFVMRARASDADLAQRILTGLANGQASIERRINWEHLQALGVNVGATYTRLPSDQERARYRDTFIRGFAEGFQRSGARPESFVNWRVQEREEGYSVVAADYAAKRRTLLLRLAKSGGRRLEGIQWQ